MSLVMIVAGPNGAGKTTFARELLRDRPEVCFINADEIAKTLPAELTGRARDLRAGRELIGLLAQSLTSGADIMLETTLASLRYLQAIPSWRANGHEVELFYLRLPSADMAVERVARRVASGGHGIPEVEIRRRFDRSLAYFKQYSTLVDAWYLFDWTGEGYELTLTGENHEP